MTKKVQGALAGVRERDWEREVLKGNFKLVESVGDVRAIMQN